MCFFFNMRTCGFQYMRRRKFFCHMRTATFLLHAVAIENGPRDIKTEIVTKVVPVRAVNLSTGPFCTEFRRESFRDDDAFLDRGAFSVDFWTTSGLRGEKHTQRKGYPKNREYQVFLVLWVSGPWKPNEAPENTPDT